MTFIQLSPQAVHKNNEGQHKLIKVLAKHSGINPILYDKNSSVRMKNLAYTSVLPSKEDYFLIFGGKKPPTAGWKSSQTGGVWLKSPHEECSAKAREKSLFGHVVCSEEILEKTLGSNIFRILESGSVSSPFIIKSKTAKEKLESTEILTAVDPCCFESPFNSY